MSFPLHIQDTVPLMNYFESNVPRTLEGWEDDFVIPRGYSIQTTVALKSGVMTSAARREIIQTTAAKMMSICQYPTVAQFECIARKIVKDLLSGKGDTFVSGHVSYYITYNDLLKFTTKQHCLYMVTTCTLVTGALT